jgi:hypothetical protein
VKQFTSGRHYFGILKIGRKLAIGTNVVQRVFEQEPRPS